MNEIYLVYEVGFEGIDEIRGPFFEAEEATKFVEGLRAEYIKKAVGDDKWWYSEKAKRVCLRRGNEEKRFECVCDEFDLGVGELVLY